MRRWLPQTAWDHPVSVLMVFLALLVLGVIGYQGIPLQMMPDGFEPRFLWVRVPWPNATPAESDERLVRPMEEELSTLQGLKTMESWAYSDGAGFELEFHPSVPMSTAYNDVIDRLERSMPALPDEVDRYWVFKFNPSDQPILWTGVTFPDHLEDPFGVLEKVVLPRLERVPGVASIDQWGVNGRRVFIDYDRERMLAHGVDIGTVQRKLQTDNFQMSGGRIEDGGLVRHVRSLARIPDIETFRRYPLRDDGLVLGDIADVELRGVVSADINRVNGERSAALAIRKESSANTVEVTGEVIRVLRELEADPRAAGARFHTFFDQGRLIARSVDTLKEAALTGGLMSVLILWVFLREWRMTLLIGLSIPFSLLITIAALYARGDSLNLVAMMGLLLAVGMVIDNAIVVVEAIYAQRAQGASIREAAISGTAEVGLAIVASTATTMVVFLPVMLMTEDANAAFFLRVLGIPVILSLAASLLVALVFAPLATRVVRGGQVRPDPPWLVRLGAGYARVLGAVLRWRADAVMVVLAAVLLTGAIAVPGVRCVPGDQGGMNDFVIRFELPRDSTPDERDTIARAFESYVEEHRDAWGVRVYRVQLGGTSSRGRVFVYLDDEAGISRSEVIQQARKSLPKDIPGVTASIGWERQGGQDRQIELELYGEDTEVLTGLAEEVVRRVRGLEGVLGAELDVDEEGLDEIRLRPDRDALRRYGVTAQQLAQTVAFAMRGTFIEDLDDGRATFPVETRVALEDRSRVETLLDFPIFSVATGQMVPARALTDLEFGKATGNVRREDRRTSLDVSIDLADGVEKADVMQALDAALADMVLPRGYAWDAGGWRQDLQQENSALAFAFLMSVVFVFLLMGVLFESWILPLSIITTIPMAMLGAWWSLYVTGTGMDTMAGIGLVVLVGVVVNNGIVLVDAIQQLRVAGAPRDQAILEAGKRRLRPILMTAVTTIIGLVPMAMGDTDFIGIPYAPLGRTVIGGMVAATVLTLLFVPFMYVLLDDLRTWWSKVRTYWRTA